MSNTQHAPFASPYSYSPPGAISTPNNLACTIVSEGGTDFYTVVVPAAGTFDAGANPMTLTTIYPGLLAKIVNNQAGDFLVKGSKAGDPGVLCLAGATTVVTDDGKGNLMEVANSSTSGSSGTGPLFTSALAKGLVDTNVPALGAFTCSGAGRDGLTYAQGDLVVLGQQTNAQENGPYFVGAVVANVAPLTRPAWWATGSIIPQNFFFYLATGGTNYGNLALKTMVAAAKVVDTDNPVLRLVGAGGTVDPAIATNAFQIGRGLVSVAKIGNGDFRIIGLAGLIDFTKSIVRVTPRDPTGHFDVWNTFANSATSFEIQSTTAGGLAQDTGFDVDVYPLTP